MSELPKFPEATHIALYAASDRSTSPVTQQLIAYTALSYLYPGAAPRWLGAAVGYSTPGLAEAMSLIYLYANAFSTVDVDHVIGAIVAPLYGERAN
ncbi:hypothetical protein [Agrobacterium tumefaciens]|uniref:hypothetical protein n=1 Tax=Agrobacterium tumefaciens TaxID=358 RepID=UPI0021D1BD2A|nr:hypothetical protein [Agrobacterium tumefaciens]UXS01120.1 hypothetical protein FY156_06255 [Agrobacterium tumefaciens]